MYVKGLVMPMDDAKNESKGFAFIEFLDKKVCSVFLSFFFGSMPPQSARPLQRRRRRRRRRHTHTI